MQSHLGESARRIAEKISGGILHHQEMEGPPHPHRRVTIDALPEDVLLEIFSSYARGELDAPVSFRTQGRLGSEHSSGPPPHPQPSSSIIPGVWQWHRIAHVYRRWRRVILSSPRRLGLRLYCTYGKPIAHLLDYWSALPIQIDYFDPDVKRVLSPKDEDNIVATLQKPMARIHQVKIFMTPSFVAKLATVAWEDQVFPYLQYIHLSGPGGEVGPVVLPKRFLEGPAPRLKRITLDGVAAPALLQLLSSSRDLIYLHLKNIPASAPISAAALVRCLSAMPRLEFLILEKFPTPPGIAPADSVVRAPPPLNHPTALPALEFFSFKGTSEALEDLVARFVAPRLGRIYVVLHNQLAIDLTHLGRFLAHSPHFKRFDTAKILLYKDEFVSLEPESYPSPVMSLKVLCKPLDWQISAIAQVCASLRHTVPAVHALSIVHHGQPLPHQLREVGPEQWLELLRPFISVERLTTWGTPIDAELARALCAVPPDVAVLPALRELDFWQLDSVEESDALVQAFTPFVDARRQAGRPVLCSF